MLKSKAHFCVISNPGISEHQTREMQAENVQLVLPRSLHEFFMPAQQAWLMDVADFIHLVR